MFPEQDKRNLLFFLTLYIVVIPWVQETFPAQFPVLVKILFQDKCSQHKRKPLVPRVLLLCLPSFFYKFITKSSYQDNYNRRDKCSNNMMLIFSDLFLGELSGGCSFLFSFGFFFFFAAFLASSSFFFFLSHLSSENNHQNTFCMVTVC